MYKLLSFFEPYLIRVEISEGYIWFDFRVPSYWELPQYVLDFTGFIDFGLDHENKMLRFVAQYNEVALDETEKIIRDFINHNLELSKKKELFLASTEALKEIFSKSSLDKLSNIKIVFDGESTEMVGEGEE